ncbi:unnamed protein product [Linum tenue]|uniref:histidine kinase n=1 Tax=Linum tenue TaxID=586396 RepID=A0AAV0LYA7_9ROSI|nr:unnamed protein product [Linum tenue]
MEEMEMEIEVLPSMWPEDIDSEKPYNVERPAGDGEQDMLEEVTIRAAASAVDFHHLKALTSYTDRGSHQMSHLMRHWEHQQANAQILVEKLEENMKELEGQGSPVEELSQILKRADNFLHFVLQNAPVVIGHQDKELKYRFIYNQYPSLNEQDILGKTDVEIFKGAGVRESQDFKKEVLEKGVPAKREIAFETELFGLKTFLIYVEPVFSKTGETIGVNYMGMDVTDQVRKREKMAKIREEIAVQKAKETELNKTIHITEETMRAKQMLATMSHEIRSPLSGVVSMAEILSNTKLDREQRNLLNVMISSGDLVLQLINDILDLSKVESGVMKLEATKFRPREVVKHVLQTAAASLQKVLTLEGRIADDVPIEVTGDVLRIRQILTNLISNAIKFTHDGKVGIDLYIVSDPGCGRAEENHKLMLDQVTANGRKEEQCTSTSQSCNGHQNGYHDDNKHADGASHNHKLNDNEPRTPVKNENTRDRGGEEEEEEECHVQETTVWLRCDVYDTGIGIPENALPNLFKKYMQASTDHARKYGGTGLGLAICKQLVELMGGQLTVTSRVNHGSTFTFVLPYKVSPACDSSSDDQDELSDMTDHNNASVSDQDETAGFFQFQPRLLGSLFSSSNGPIRIPKLVPNTFGNTNSPPLNGFLEDGNSSFPSSDIGSKETTTSVEDAYSTVESIGTTSEPGTLFGSVSKECQNGELRSTESIRRTNSEESTSGSQGSCLSTENHDRSSQQCSSSGNNTSHAEADKVKPKPRILLVEDNKINVMVTQSMMKQLGHSIEVVNNGIEAVKAIQRRYYDLVLMVNSSSNVCQTERLLLADSKTKKGWFLCRMYTCQSWMVFKLQGLYVLSRTLEIGMKQPRQE